MLNSKKENFPHKTGDQSYNRKSGEKTLIFVGICIVVVIALSITSFLMFPTL